MRKKKLFIRGFLLVAGCAIITSVFCTSFSTPEINKMPASPPVVYENQEGSEKNRTGELFKKEFSLTGLIPTFGTIEE